jgi:tetratricopeptide (TPR) repeat protein
MNDRTETKTRGDSEPQLKTLSRRQLVAIARACKNDGLCGPYSVLKKAELVEQLSKINKQELQKYLRIPWWDYLVANRLEFAAWCGLLITTCAWFFPFSTSDSKLLAIAVAQSARLTEQLTKEIEKANEADRQRDQLVAGIGREIASAPKQSKEMLALSQKLGDLIASIENRKSGTPLSDDAAITIHLAKAALSLAKNKTDETLKIVSKPFLDDRIEKAKQFASDASIAATLRGLALQDVGDWNGAVDVYKQIATVSSDRYFQLELAHCLSMSGRSQPAIKQLDELIQLIESSRARSPHDNLSLASAYKIRGVILGGQDYAAKGIEDLRTAIALFTTVGNSDLSIISCWINIGIFSFNIERAKSHEAFQKAAELVKKAGLEEEDKQYALMMIGNHQAAQFAEEGNLTDAIAASESVVEMRRANVKKHNNVESQLRLAESLNTLSTTYRHNPEYLWKAVNVLTEALELTSKLVDAGQHDAITPHIGILINRAAVRVQLEEFYKAAEDGASAITLSEFLNSIAGADGTPSGRRYLAHSLSIYSDAVRRLGDYENAIADADRAIELYNRLETDGQHEFAFERSQAMNTRAMILAATGKFDEAIAQYRKLDDLVKQLLAEHPTPQREELRLAARANYAECLMATGNDLDAKELHEDTLRFPANFSTSPIVVIGIARIKAAYSLILCVSEKVSDPPAALKLATEARTSCDTLWQIRHVLAAAHAENGDFVSAIEIEQQAVEMCPNAFKPIAESTLEGYKKGTTIRLQRRAGKKEPS